MAVPSDLEDFAVGFSPNQRIVGAAAEVEELVVVIAAGQVPIERMSVEKLSRL
jgi:formate dehydrogenase assembly factor FdhD